MLKYHEDLDTHLDPHEEPKCETEIILRTRSLRMPSTTGGGGHRHTHKVRSNELERTSEWKDIVDLFRNLLSTHRMCEAYTKRV